MPSTSGFFRHKPLLQGLQQATWICAIGWSLAGATPALGQTQWRSVSGAAPVPDVVVTAIPGAASQKPKDEAQTPAEGGLQMFGVRLGTATREVMRQAIRRAGLTVHREDGAFQEDIYEAPNLMPGLLQLKFSYARQGQKLARVDYVFMTFSDNAHVEDVKLRIEGRFGAPLRVTGREESGPYQAVWRLPDEMEIVVGREWPKKTTYLRFLNLSVLTQAPAGLEREAVKARREKIQNSQALPIWVKQ